MVRHFSGDTCDEVWRAAAVPLAAGMDAAHTGSRQGDTLEYLHCIFEVRDPRQRWVLSRTPALNPAFAIAEVIWILLGSRSSKLINYWNRRLPQFAGRGEKYHGAYGYRLRARFGFDQIDRACDALSANRDSRQVVLQIWNAEDDLPNADGTPRDADIPCNLVSMLKIRDAHLYWTQVLRSNDLFLGVPHNFVQFTTLQEVVSGCLGVGLGPYVHISDSLHLYAKDSAAFGVSSPALRVPNTDNLAVPRHELATILGAVGELMLELSGDGLPSSAIMRVATDRALPEAWRNLVCVLAADAARRRRWFDEMAAAVAGCTNPVLQTAWAAWQKRVG
ncbi:thymidylate synthase [Ramlibacter sp.]|uniref:thymidylate synthase n=1 Tax=Ramlibacter sp. TaxID=1917967 RepID=UPI002CA440C2|nr:thymidylate synthase [Ramlibacter sp.]HWI81567.1 thymidylate synthase [Ramlibacter sp.]